MGGVDTVRGIGYQQAQAVLAALDVLDRADLSAIRVEGADDVVDLELLAADGSIRHGSQIKTRCEPYTWSESELLTVLRRWAALPASEGATFEFLTDGRLGPSASAVGSALNEAALGRLDPLARLLGEEPSSRSCQVLRYATIRVDPTAIGTLLLRAEQQVAAVIPNVRTVADAQEQASSIVGQLFRVLVERAGTADPDARLVSRAELAAIIGVDDVLGTTVRWSDALKDNCIGAAVSDLERVVLPTIGRLDDHDDVDESERLRQLVEASPAALLCGRTGEGKSTSLAYLRRMAAMGGRLLLVAHAETYIPGRLPALAADSIANYLGRPVPVSAGSAALADPTVTLALDGASEIPRDVQAELQRDVGAILASGHGARVLLAGRDVAALRAILPTRVIPPTFAMRALSTDRRLELIRTGALLPSPAGSESERTIDHVRAFAARAESALGEGAGNPLLLTMAVELLEGGVPFDNRATLYEQFVELLFRRGGGVDLSLVSRVLGEVFAKLLDCDRRYADPYEWRELIAESTNSVSVPGLELDPVSIAESATRCGLVTPIDYTQVLAPIHDSFADFLAGRAHANGVPLPSPANGGDEQRLLFAAEIGGVTPGLAERVAGDLPFLAVRIGDLDHRTASSDTPAQVQELLTLLLPPGESPTVNLALDERQRVVGYMSDSSSGWIELGEIDWSQDVVVVQRGPLGIATRLWRQWLKRQLQPETTLGSRRPVSIEDACGLLEAHQETSAALTLDLGHRVAPRGGVDSLLTRLRPLGIRASVDRDTNDVFGNEFPVRYVRDSDVIQVRPDHDGQDEDEYPSKSTVERLIDDAPAATAGRRVREALESLTVKGWL